jgi:hypothetical protein
VASFLTGCSHLDVSLPLGCFPFIFMFKTFNRFLLPLASINSKAYSKPTGKSFPRFLVFVIHSSVTSLPEYLKLSLFYNYLIFSYLLAYLHNYTLIQIDI